MQPEQATTMSRLRRLNIVLFGPLVIASGAITMTVYSENWRDILVLGIGLVTSVVAFVAWTHHRIRAVGPYCLLPAIGVWVYGATSLGTASAFSALLVAGGLLVPHLRHSVIAAVGLVLLVVGIGSLRFLTHSEDVSDVLLQYVVVPGGITAVVLGFMFPNKGFYDEIAELEANRERDAELAVARERIRFAGDLHDIQGHTLHVAKLKIALARKLLHTDADRAEEELAEVYDLIGDTITQTKELAYAQRRLNLSVELENARNLLEAAGITVRVVRESPEVEVGADEMLGQVLRETTTNILRHSRATQTRITLATTALTVENDGAADDPAVLKGLAALRTRVEERGGRLVADRRDGSFRTAVSLPTSTLPTSPRPEGAAGSLPIGTSGVDR